MELTGNPFVDTGLAVLAWKAGCRSVGELTLEQIRKKHGDGTELARINHKLKSPSMIFTSNSFAAYRKDRPPETRVKYYSVLSKSILDSIGREDQDHYCECCGNKKSLDLDELVRTTLGPLGYTDATRSIGRDWFPLAGSIASDAQALPAASRSPYLCAKCLFAVHYLPLGAMLMNSQLVVFQSTSESFWYRYVSCIAQKVDERIREGLKETYGKGGSSAIIEVALEAMYEMKEIEQLEKGTSLFIWRYSNSGAKPDCSVDEIPNRALEFLYDARFYGYDKQILSMVKSERGVQLIQAIQGGFDYPPLYPRGKWDGAPPKLFHLYQSRVRGIPTLRLQAASKIAEYARSHLEKKQLDTITTRLISDSAQQSQIKRIIAEMVKAGELSAEEYLQLFSSSEDGAYVSYDAWKFIGYYLSVGAFEKSSLDIAAPKLSTNMMYYASTILTDYLQARGKDRFERDVLKQLELNRISSGWLMRRFLDESRRRDGYNYTEWKSLTSNDSGWDLSREVLYRMRLLWLEWLRLGSVPEYPAPAEKKWKILDTNLSPKIAEELVAHLESYLAEKGEKRFKRNVVDGVFSGETDLYWFRDALKTASPELGREDGWERFLNDMEGNSIRRLRLFQMQLLVTNFYREKIIYHKGGV